MMFSRVLVANRGEIALRVIRCCRDLGIRSIAVHAHDDRDAAFVRLADEALDLGPGPASQTYLSVERIIEAARVSGAEAIHPGYGFLSENRELAGACLAAGIRFIGPPPEAMAAMGDKIAARARMGSSGVPVIAGSESLGDVDAAAAAAALAGYPVLLKASAGGGGIGMRVARDEADLRSAFGAARSTAERAFGDGRIFVERYVPDARHIEIQVLADSHGHAVHLGERECSVQRRFQKVIEESPSTVIDGPTRHRMGEAALSAARAIGYVNAGTVEFVYSASTGEFFFLEMNTRLQVEHPVTEAVYGVDLVAEQFRIAAGEPLHLGQDELSPRGHAIECRVYAEDPARNFMPCPGRVTAYAEPSGPGVRVDGALRGPGTVPATYDPMIAKVIVWGPDRDAAIRRMRRALLEYGIAGITTNLPYLLAILDSGDFTSGSCTTRYLDEHPELVEATPRWEAERARLLRGLGGDGARVAAIAAAVTVARG